MTKTYEQLSDDDKLNLYLTVKEKGLHEAINQAMNVGALAFNDTGSKRQFNVADAARLFGRLRKELE